MQVLPKKINQYSSLCEKKSKTRRCIVVKYRSKLMVVYIIILGLIGMAIRYAQSLDDMTTCTKNKPKKEKRVKRK